MNLNIRSRGLLALIVFLAALSGYGWNVFAVVPQARFDAHQLDSEQLVLDALLRADREGGAARLGRYWRPDIPDQVARARELYAHGNISDEFVPYRSQYGLQTRVFAIIREVGIADVQTLELLVAGCMAALVTLVSVVMTKRAGIAVGIAIAVAMVFNPWVTLFARNLYWVMFTWYLPLAVMLLGALLPRAGTLLTLPTCVALMGAFLVKFLCGYEYATTVVIAAAAPLLLHLQSAGGWPLLVRDTMRYAAVVSLAFAAALLVHMVDLRVEAHRSWYESADVIAELVRKRVATAAPADVARKNCGGSSQCEAVVVTSLQARTIEVAGQYLLFHDFLPWGHVLARQPAWDGWRPLMTVPAGRKLIPTFLEFPWERSDWLAFGAFPILLLGALAVSLRLGKVVLGAITLAVAAPLSWGLAAKGHSTIHYHINYVLWSLPTVPFAVALLVGGGRRAIAGQLGKRKCTV